MKQFLCHRYKISLQIFLLIPILVIYLSTSLHAEQPAVYVLTLNGAINPAAADYIHSVIEKAHKSNGELIVIQLNTPGGLLKSTRVIVTDILNSPIPIVVYVTPGGSQAASAGVFVTLAANIAAMAPGTNIGAAHPVSGQGEQPDSIMMGKVTNDAAAFIRTIAEKRNRNMAWAEDAVRKSLSITETEALKLRVIDFIARDRKALLDSLDRRAITINSGQKILNLSQATEIMVEMDWRQKFLDVLSDPNFAYIFLMLGFYGLLFELYNPGSIFPGIVGVISLILAFYSLHTLPVNYAGLGLIIFSIILFIAEIKIVSHGLLAIGGTISFILGSLMLIDTEPGMEYLAISWKVLVPAVIFTVAFFVFIIGLGIRAQRRKPTTGSEGLIGKHGTVIQRLDPEGRIRIHGEIWFARTDAPPLEAGTDVTVTAVNDLVLTVIQKERSSL
jgi:membrane-bound serine protease (ClpP class)